MKKILKAISLIISVVLVLGLFAGCGAPQTSSVNGIELLKGDSEGIKLYNSIAASMPVLTAAPSEILTKIPAGVTVITDEMLYTSGNGVTDDSILLREGIALAAVYEKGSFVISSELKIEESIVIPSNVSLCFRGNGKIILGNSAYLYFENGSQIIAGNKRIFSGAVGNLSVIADPDNPKSALSFAVRPEWFGAVANDGLDVANDDSAAIQAAMSFATKIYFGVGQYFVNAVLSLPSSHPVDIIGSGRNRTEFVLGGDTTTYVNGNGTTFGIYDMNVVQIAHFKTATFVSLENGSVKVSAVAFHGLATGFSLKNCSNSSFEYFFSTACSVLVNLVNCNKMTFNSSLCNGNKSFLVADGSSNLSFTNSSSVWGFGTDYTFNNCHGIVMNALGCDLGYDAVDTSGNLLYGNNLYAIYMEGCYDFNLKDLWCASNSGLSKTHDFSIGVSEAYERTGMCFVNSYKGTVSYCTITNHPVGVKVIRSHANAATTGNGISFVGNQFVGNKFFEIQLDKANNVSFLFNNHKQMGSSDFNGGTCVEASGNQCTNISFIGDTFYSFNSSTEIRNAFPNSTVYFDSIINANTGNPMA